MVTPLSQFVVSQAAINVIVGERYKEVTDQVIQYALGQWGREAPALMAVDVKDKVLSRPRAKHWRDWRPAELSLKDLRQKFGGASVSDEELLLRIYAGSDAVNALANGGAPPPRLDGRQPLFRLIEELGRKSDCRGIFIRKGGVSLVLGKRPDSANSA
jgi:oxaloacetate decarboxylase alpha subunit